MSKSTTVPKTSSWRQSDGGAGALGAGVSVGGIALRGGNGGDVDGRDRRGQRTLSFGNNMVAGVSLGGGGSAVAAEERYREEQRGVGQGALRPEVPLMGRHTREFLRKARKIEI